MKDKPRKKKKRKKKNYLLRLLVIIAVGVGLYFLLSSELFDVGSVKIANNKYYTVEQVKDKAGVKVGENIFSINTGKIKDNLLKDPYFENVKIRRKLPSTVLIDVTERKEAAAVQLDQHYIIIDPNGLVLRKADSAPKLTILEGLTVKKSTVGKALEVEGNSILAHTLEMLKAMNGSELFFKKIDISSVVIKAYIYDQLICEGTPTNMTENIKNGNLEMTLYDMYNKGIERGVLKIGSDNYCSFDPMIE
ncbi:cell division protein FtsQ/DivIB [Clostridium aminobutyricum]|uniref:FtsQ-type POTRA domain-containing protein n=1 Tax=Clostridium aminobutyricum TaxID=33953 RepID=A0A939DBJ5_CLOAM|nr:FtsQ-type POTRA domain-containing protein [Clostridium aminobutyricum]MBN7774243.1 FtsQ-type POTRA domain-containing protein [Clostridium aminobutyricum]